MRQRNLNTEHIEGRIYQHDLSIKTVQNPSSDNFGKEFISGTLDVATDEEGLNVLTVHFTYVTETTKTGKTNRTYSALKDIINSGKCWITDGPESATKVKIDTALDLNDFYGQDEILVSVKRNEGGFVSIVDSLSSNEDERNTFTEDMVITSINHVDVDPDKNITEPYTSIRGAVFNFRNDLLPVEFVVKNPAGMKYFENLDVSNSSPIFTKVWGQIMSSTIVIEQTEESAFGEAAVKKVERKTKEWVITGTARTPYDYGDPEILDDKDLTKAMQNREIKLADIKKRQDEYSVENKKNTNSTISSSVKTGSFNF